MVTMNLFVCYCVSCKNSLHPKGSIDYAVQQLNPFYNAFVLTKTTKLPFHPVCLQSCISCLLEIAQLGFSWSKDPRILFKFSFTKVSISNYKFLGSKCNFSNCLYSYVILKAARCRISNFN